MCASPKKVGLLGDHLVGGLGGLGLGAGGRALTAELRPDGRANRRVGLAAHGAGRLGDHLGETLVSRRREALGLQLRAERSNHIDVVAHVGGFGQRGRVHAEVEVAGEVQRVRREAVAGLRAREAEAPRDGRPTLAGRDRCPRPSC
jgi:hypothetical protein